MRLDVFLTQNNYVETRTRAKNLIELERVFVNNKAITKASFDVTESDKIEISEDYDASLGSLKLTKAIEDFHLDINNKTCLDVGASNGGFTEILLKNGASIVYALDIGECALPDRLKNDPRVIVKDRTNARYITKGDFDHDINLCSVDVSFISLKLILPALKDTLGSNGEVIALIKPQFELDKKVLPKSGVIKNPTLQQKVIDDISLFSKNLGFHVKGVTTAPHPFKDKNQEYLIHLVL